MIKTIIQIYVRVKCLLSIVLKYLYVYTLSLIILYLIVTKCLIYLFIILVPLIYWLRCISRYIHLLLQLIFMYTFTWLVKLRFKHAHTKLHWLIIFTVWRNSSDAFIYTFFNFYQSILPSFNVLEFIWV